MKRHQVIYTISVALVYMLVINAVVSMNSEVTVTAYFDQKSIDQQMHEKN
jgi:hypothetical protein